MGNTCCAPEFRLDGSVTGVVFRVGLYQDDPSMEPPEQVKIPNPEPTTDDQQTPKASKPSELVTIPEEPEPPTPEETATAPPPPSPETIKPDRHMKRVSSTVPRDGCVLPQTEKITNFEDLYTCGKELGRGEFGTTFECVEKATGKRYACKTIEKSKISTDVDAEEVRREIEIMHRLRRLPNVVSIEEAYEDDRAVHIVMELCEGGDLSKAISRCQNYREREVAKLAMKIVRAVKACHSLKVMHRDIKPDNFLFVNSEDGPLKIIDFGLSTFFKPAGERCSDVVGCPYYVAPEVFTKNYDPKADVWSTGVSLYYLLSGSLPFQGATEDEIRQQVLNHHPDFKSDPWRRYTEAATDVVRRMLDKDPERRISISEVLSHPWIQLGS